MHSLCKGAGSLPEAAGSKPMKPVAVLLVPAPHLGEMPQKKGRTGACRSGRFIRSTGLEEETLDGLVLTCGEIHSARLARFVFRVEPREPIGETVTGRGRNFQNFGARVNFANVLLGLFEIERDVRKQVYLVNNHQAGTRKRGRIF